MSEELTRFQIQLLLYFLEAEPKKRTVTDAARYFGKTKVSVTRTLDSLEKLGIVERTQARKTVLSHYGTKLAQKFQQQYQIAERYMQYLDLTPLQAKNNALSALLAGFSEEYLNRMQEQEERMYIKEVFAGRQNFSGQELCDYLKDGSYFFPFVIYREHIKNGNNITYYGGKTQQMEKTTRVKARVKAQALKEFMSTKDRVVVMGHKITDVDALGAAIGIYRAGKTLGKTVNIVVNDPTTSIRPLMMGYMNNSEYEPSMFITSDQARDLVDNNTVVVVVDTNKPSYTECQDLLYMTKTVVVLDHHRRGSEVIENAVLSYVEPYASSACEMVAEILQYFSDDLRIRSMEADCLYAGIMIDTNNFTTRAGVRTFEAAAFLRRSGADVTRVRKMLRDNLESYQARAEAVRTAHIDSDCFAIARCPSEGVDSPTVVGAQAANELLNIAGVKASFVLTQYNNEVYISARAIDEVNVQVMMEKMGGGGHMNIAGAQVKASPDEVEKMLKDIIDKEYQEESVK